MTERQRPEAPREGGDPACWLDQVCPECGHLTENATRCPSCGTALNPDEDE
jgi:rubrerythrin